MEIQARVDEALSEFDGDARNAIAALLGKIDALRAEVKRAELAADGWTPASEPPLETDEFFGNRDILMLMADGSQKRGWHASTGDHWFEVMTDRDDVSDPPVAWKELEA